MKMILLLQVVLLGSSGAHNAAQSDDLQCDFYKRCNGIMCKDVCKPGSVVIPSFTEAALKFQRNLQLHEPLVKSTFIGTHNSAISQAYGFGIEQDYIQELTGEKMYQGDDLGEGVCQTLPVLDQLKLGLRHIEIDITSGYFELFDPALPRINQIFVCHSPIPLDPEIILKTDEAAALKGIKLGWDLKNLSCEHTNVPFRLMLIEIKSFLDANPEELVILYLDTKPLTVELPSQAAAMYDVMLGVFNDSIWIPKMGSPLNHTRAELLAMGKRVIFEDHDDGYNHPAHGEVLVFTPDLFQHQFGASDLTPFPSCNVQGDNAWYGNKLVRALSTTDPFIVGANKCGVNVISGDYIMPSDLYDYVWAIDTNKTLNPNQCVARQPSGTFTTVDCTTSLAYACVDNKNDTNWYIETKVITGVEFMKSDGGSQVCKPGLSARAPANGFTNGWLGVAQIATNVDLVWLYVLPSGLAPPASVTHTASSHA